MNDTQTNGAQAGAGTSQAEAQELARLLTAVQDALTDSMVERLAVTGANALEVVDRLNDDETRAAIHYVLDQLTELHRTGALATLFELVTLIHGARNAMTDSILERLFAFLEHMLNTVATEEMATLADNLRISMEEAVKETSQGPVRGGLLATLSMVSKPEAQRTLRFFLAFGEKFQKRAIEQG